VTRFHPKRDLHVSFAVITSGLVKHALSKSTTMNRHPTSPGAITKSLWRNRELIKASLLREVSARYKGSIFGILWSFLIPLCMLTIYTFVFSEVFKARWQSNTSRAEFALVLFVGLIVFNFFSECISRAPTLILSNPNYVKKIIFPLEILPCVALGSSLFHAGISLIVWLGAYAILVGVPPVTAIFLPLVLFPFILLILGLSWLLASLGVYVRDVGQAIGIVVSALMFMSPIFYPTSSIPADYQFLLYINPVTLVVEQARDILYWGKYPDFLMLGQYSVASFFVASFGFFWFQKTREGFADVL
jgi:lipopolysaccharide transport system permease protein